jgi:hypothetical protein
MDRYEERERLKRKWERCNKKGEFKINEKEKYEHSKGVNQAGSDLIRRLRTGSGKKKIFILVNFYLFKNIWNI